MTAHSKPTVAHLCDCLVEAYRKKGLEMALQPGLTEQDINAIASSAGLKLPPELVELYRWHNGPAAERAQPLTLAGKAFLSLENAATQREAMLAALHPKDREDPTIHGLFPFASANGEWYAMAQGNDAVFLVVEDAKPDFESLDAMLKTCIDWVNESDWTPASPPAKAMEIWYRHNPSMEL